MDRTATASRSIPAVEEFSAEREVRALNWAMKMIRARNESAEAFHAVEIKYYADLKARNEYQDMRALWFAFTRLASKLANAAALGAGDSQEEALLRAYNDLAHTSLEHDPDDPWAWLEHVGADNAAEQLRYLRGDES